MPKPMHRKLNSFAKVAILIFGLLFLMMSFFTIYNRVTVQVMKTEIETANLNKLVFLKDQLEEKINQISINAITLASDPAIRELEFLQQSGDPYDKQKLTRMILDHISLQSGITGWWTEITVYSRMTHDVVSTSSDTFGFVDEELIDVIRRGWQFQRGEAGESDKFVWYAVTPETAYDDPASARLIVKTAFDASYLQNVLDQFKSNGQGDPLLYSPELGMIGNRTIDGDYAAEALRYLGGTELGDGRTNLSVQLSDERYLMSFLPMYGTDWYLVDSIPVDSILSPVTNARNLFYAFTLALLGFGSLASYILYRQLQVPIRELVKNIQGIKRGNYGSRIQMEGSSEFSYLFQRFNEMAEEIQTLLERVYEEKIRSREALLKQLQSQINPHFLYNCLFYIKNMARLGDEESVVAMSLNLGEYFRYTTRLGKQTAQLREELDVIVNYLEIQNLRTNRISYRIDVDESLKAMEFPRLILQPVVENAVIHGIEPKDGRGYISIEGGKDASGYALRIEDNGVGMDDDRLAALQRRLEQPDNQDNVSFGLWNVNQRLKLMFGESSGLSVSRKEGGGTAVTIVIRGKGEESDVPHLDR
ncbi:sensor histidine kinase [Paenibacillus antri]|uniref:Sensor histidine kinase n=1 Tax=Paenibacillus antri TaxID=2582848 RepID=A0A5R9GKJ5_9BACL|nr:histidine kinase [Paenibacillus antri]TLS54028.1 sensor histidine kinase [Paenibacillus antri]